MTSPKRSFQLGSPPTSGSASSSELQVPIDCRGRRTDDVLADLDRGLAMAEVRGCDPLVILRNLGLLADSITNLIKGISHRLVGYPRTVTFWEESGYTEAFLSAMDGRGSRPPDEASR